MWTTCRVALLFLLLTTGKLWAQFTQVSGTVVDPQGIPYANGTISPILISNGTPTLNGLAYSPPTQPVGLDGNGTFLMQLADVTLLSPPGSQWNFWVCSGIGSIQPAAGAGSVCFILATPISISGATQDISTNLQAAALPLSRIGTPLNGFFNSLTVGTTVRITPASNLQNAINGLPVGGGTVELTGGTYSLSSGISISGNNVTISCLAGAVIVPTANSLTLFTVTGGNDTITGCTFVLGSFASIVAIWDNGATNFTSTWNTFSGSATSKGNVVGCSTCAGMTGFYSAHNVSTGLYYGDEMWNVDQATVEYNTGTTPARDCAYNNTTLNMFTAGSVFVYRHNVCINPAGIALMEWAGNGYRWIDFEDNHLFDNQTPCHGLLSGGSNHWGGATDQLLGGYVANNSGECTGSVHTTGNYCIEIYGHDYTIQNNVCNGPWLDGFLYDGWNHRFIGNSLSGIGVPTANSGDGFGFKINVDSHQNLASANTFEYNVCTNVQSVCIGGVNGAIIRGNRDNRSFGAFASDATQTYQAFGTNSSLTSVVESNTATLTAPSNGFDLSSPGTFKWACFSSFGTGVVSYLNNTCNNSNATQFGQLLYGGSKTYFDNATITGTKVTNLAKVGSDIPSWTSSTVQYGNNSAVSSVADFILTPMIYASRGGTWGGATNYCSDCAGALGSLTGGSGNGGKITYSNGIWLMPDNSTAPSCGSLGTYITVCTPNGPSNKTGSISITVAGGSQGSGTNIGTLTWSAPMPTGYMCSGWDNSQRPGYYFNNSSTASSAFNLPSTVSLTPGTYVIYYTCNGPR